MEVNALLDELGLRGWPKTSGSRGIHVNVRIEPRWTFTEVRRAALALSREIERRLPGLATSKWWKEERQGVFLDYNQNAKDRTTCSAYSVRPLPDARVSAPLTGMKFPIASRPTSRSRRCRSALQAIGDPHADMDASAGSLESLLELAIARRSIRPRRRTLAAAFSERGGRSAARCASRAKARPTPKAKTPRKKMPLLVVANSPDKEAGSRGPRALEGTPSGSGASISMWPTCWSTRCAGAHRPGPASA